MIASDVLTLGAAIVGLLTSIAGSSACFYSSFRTNKMNLSILKVRVHNLENLVDALQQKLNGVDVLKPDPSPWIEQAKDFLNKVNVLDLENRLNENCVNGRVPNLWYQCGAARSIEEKIQELDVLLENGKQVSQEAKVKGSKQPEVQIVGDAREKIRQKLWKQVSEGTAAAVACIHGIAGVGKTALAATIHNQALVELTSFENVIWVNVEHGSGLRHIQEEIASKLYVDLSGSADNVERAKILRNALMQKGKFLLVLDSMWQAFSLHDIGIPEPSGGSKLLLTSRAYSTCRTITRKIRSKEIYEIEPLSEEEAWELFKGEVGPNILHLESETLQMAKHAVQDLDGLPLAVKMLAETFSEIDDGYPSRIDGAWREELSALSTSTSFLGNKSQEFFDCFKYSYEKLGEHSMSCFMYCTLLPKGNLMNARELIEYWMWEGLLGQISSLEESMRQGRRILNELKDAHLLEYVKEEGKEDSVKMLNVVRHVALDAIAKSGHQFFIKSSNSLSELPLPKDWPTDTERASFVQNQVRALRNIPDCKKLCTLLLQDNPLNLNHHDYFFSKIRNLKVLDLSRTNISSLPKSLSGLTDLHALLLRNCANLKRLPSLSNLLRLIVIDLSGTPLEQVPEGLQNLTNLRRLDLSQTLLEVFPDKVVGKLTQVEELLLITSDHGGYVWGSKQLFPQWPGACVEELVDLKRLVVLELTFLNIKVFNRYVGKIEEQQASVPHRFRFCVGGFYTGVNVGDNSIAVIGDCNITLPDRTLELHLMFSSQKITSLKFDGCLRYLTVVDVTNFVALTYLFTLEMLGNLRSLKKICVKRCEKMVSIVQPAAEANPSSITLPQLMTFVLFDLPELKSICDAEVLNCPSLRGIEAWNCQNLKLPKVLLGRNSGIIEIKGDKEWVEEVKEKSSSSNSTFKYNEAIVPEELSSTPSFRIRRQESFLSQTQRSSGRFGFPSVSLARTLNRKGDTTPTVDTTSGGTLSKFVVMVRGGLAFSQSAGSLHIANSQTDAMLEDSGSSDVEVGLSQIIKRTGSSRSDS